MEWFGTHQESDPHVEFSKPRLRDSEEIVVREVSLLGHKCFMTGSKELLPGAANNFL